VVRRQGWILLNDRLTAELKWVGEGTLLVGVCGEIEADTAGTVREVLVRACDQATQVVFDLGRVSFIDSTGLGVIVAASTRPSQKGAEFSLLRPPPSVLRTLQLFGLDALISDMGQLDP